MGLFINISQRFISEIHSSQVFAMQTKLKKINVFVYILNIEKKTSALELNDVSNARNCMFNMF